MTDHTHTHRRPYVGEGEDGARRSARIDREEADGLDILDPRYDEVQASAARWDQQARDLMLERVGPRPTMQQVHESSGSGAWLAGLALLRLSPAVEADAAQWAHWSDSGSFTYAGEGADRAGTFHPDAIVDWQGWAHDVDVQGRGWSSSERHLFDLVAGLTVPDRKVALVGTLDELGSWKFDALRYLVNWASGGSKEHAGSFTVARRAEGTDEDQGERR